jgi:hypothetical protein
LFEKYRYANVTKRPLRYERQARRSENPNQKTDRRKVLTLFKRFATMIEDFYLREKCENADRLA